MSETSETAAPEAIHPGTPCPVLRSGINPENEAVTGVPPLPYGKARITSIYKHLRHQGAGRFWAGFISFAGMGANGFGPGKLLRNLFTLSIDLADLTGGPFDKVARDTGILQAEGDGVFVRARFDRMVDGWAKPYRPAGGDEELGFTWEDLKSFIDANVAEDDAGWALKFAAWVEWWLVVDIWGIEAADGVDYVPVEDVLSLFRDRRWPRKRAR